MKIKEKFLRGFISYINEISEIAQYNWDDDFKKNEFYKTTKRFQDYIKEEIDLDNISQTEAVSLGFSKLREDSNIWLLPLYLLPIIPIGMKLYDIYETEIIYDGKNIDNDIRCGCIAYGIKIKSNE